MSPVKIGVLISGGGTNLQSIIDNIENGNINGEIKLIISNRKDAYGLTRGKDAGIESIYLDRKLFNSEEEYNLYLIKELKKRDIELIVLAGYLKVLSKEFIEEFSGRIINIHPSLIPSFCGKGYYGEKVHQGVLDYGVKITGATVHFVDEGTDTGAIILQDIVYVDNEDTVETLKEKVLKIEHKLLVQAVKLYCSGRISVEGRKVIIK
ncbi:formyltetrahydrofolate-dependent phosphoribosylglycinamide formyltransferase [Tissierella praeacuta DSM 18095]|uniref:Phosphoribosylglycinamide formyltransferase n=1 Tax=Tissierella praeacuta DSM 18095 TaxID=1123404 RepID=A0A1M4W809_9FIRM|nr:phosphoribosylglycinamide formyltransferase [Tissierella praeacuta]TCU75569.1 formyltetrahydrofolate-dependent phosphoribosylglycinamide formyltransferase [Tissierella praeacuta]SHE77337.1 formyltetrahydrofolate-dependent phosphoribosylglycinamide formyltransferase [Tissierella praeacuta DSM 18095]SUO99993.1 Phosphoribosylglycinamide formyltransferase [Tissierella praeacuta]